MRRPRRSFRTAAAVATAAFVTVLASCSASSSGLSAGGSGGAAAEKAAAPAAGGRARADDSGASKRSGSAGGPARAALTTRSIVRTAEIVVRTKNVQAAADRAAGLVQGGDGYVQSQQTNSDPSGDGARLSSINLVLRVPVDDFDRVARQVRALGTPVADKRDAKDVTDEVVDVDSRVASQQKSIQRLRTLLGQAKTVGEVMQVETELTTRETELESLQARYAALSSQAALSTIRVTFEAPSTATTTSQRGGFLSGLSAGWNAFVAVVQALLTALGALVPFLLAVALLLGLPLWLVHRARARRRSSTSPPPAIT